MSIREDRVRELAQRLCIELEVGRKEGMSTIEVGAAIGLMLGKMVPAETDRKSIEAFAFRHANKTQ